MGKRDLERLFLQRSDEQLSSYDKEKMREESKQLRRRAWHEESATESRKHDMLERTEQILQARAKRENQVRNLFTQGLSDKEIAERMDIPKSSVIAVRQRLGLHRLSRRGSMK